MTVGVRAGAAGLVAVAAYLALAAAGGAFRPLGGRPLYDGLAPPPPYRWVEPPPDLARGNVPPEGGTIPIPLTPEGSEPVVFSTNDLQVGVALPRAVVPPREGEESAELAITPLAPNPDAILPPGLEVKGNVYRVDVRYLPSGVPVERFGLVVQLAMAYPSEASPTRGGHVILFSPDGGRWTRLETLDSPSEHRAGADLAAPGYVAVAGPPAPGEGGWTPARIALVAGGSALGLAVLVGVIRWRGRRG